MLPSAELEYVVGEVNKVLDKEPDGYPPFFLLKTKDGRWGMLLPYSQSFSVTPDMFHAAVRNNIGVNSMIMHPDRFLLLARSVAMCIGLEHAVFVMMLEDSVKTKDHAVMLVMEDDASQDAYLFRLNEYGRISIDCFEPFNDFDKMNNLSIMPSRVAN